MNRNNFFSIFLILLFSAESSFCFAAQIKSAKKTVQDQQSPKEMPPEEDAAKKVREAEEPPVLTVDLASTAPSWVSVTGGNPLCQPVRNSFGFVVVEEGKMVSAFNQEGKVLWERGLNAKLKPLISVGASDMLYLISRDGDLNMLNPGGLLVWTSTTGFSVTEAPLSGRDGRIYVRGGSNLACYGIKGVCRWSIQLPDQNTSLPLVELNQGSVLVFLNKTFEGKSVAVTVSPFGEVGEEFAFAGKVVQVSGCENGALVSFADGGAGLCAEKEGVPFSKWASRPGENGLSSPTRIITEGYPSSKAALLSGSNIIIINSENGETELSFKTDFSPSSLTYAGRTLQGLVLADGSHATCYDLEGAPLWDAKFNPSKKWTYVFPTDQGYLAFCTRNWVTEGYRIKQNIGSSAALTSYKPKKNLPYNAFYNKISLSSSNVSGQILQDAYVSEILESFKEGNFGVKEKDWIPLLNNEMYELLSEWSENSQKQDETGPFFRTHIDYAISILNLTANSGTAMYQRYFSELLKKVEDPVMLVNIIKNAGLTSYDPNEEMLLAMEVIVNKNAKKGANENVLMAVCDATFEICRFMGRPAFFAKGKETVSKLLGPQYGKATKEYARKTLEKFIEIGF